MAIDGPSGSGKSSTARGVARRLGLAFLDTGAMYRAATWLALQRGVDLTDTAAVADLVRDAEMDMVLEPDAFTIAIDGTDVTDRDPGAGGVGGGQRGRHQPGRARRPGGPAEASDRRRRPAGSSPRAATSPPWSPRTPTYGCCWSPTRRPGSPGGTPSWPTAVDVDAVTDQVIRRDRDDSTVAQFTSAAPGVQVVDSTELTLDDVVVGDLRPGAGQPVPRAT